MMVKKSILSLIILFLLLIGFNLNVAKASNDDIK